VASVLVITADPNIESLMGQLVAFAGHRPIYDATLGAAGEAIRRARPEVVLVDSALPAPVVAACLNAAMESASEPILTSSLASESELAQEAEMRRYLYFALPGAPKPLSDVIKRAIEQRERRLSVRRQAASSSVRKFSESLDRPDSIG
jgi:DNA-binding NtrC family response regulator